MKVSGFCDLNFSIPPQHLGNSLETLISLGYKTIAFNTIVEEESTGTGKKKKGPVKEIICLPPKLEVKETLKNKIQILQRLTYFVSDGNQLQKLCKSENAKKYDIIAVIPKVSSAFQLACACKDIDLISFDPSERPVQMNRKTYNLAVSNGIYFEIPYSPAISDSGKRKNIIQIAHCYHAYGKSKVNTELPQLLSLTKSEFFLYISSKSQFYQNIVITSGATEVSRIRSPYDIVNLGLLFGLSEEQSKHSMLNTSRSLILRAEGRRFGKTAMTLMITDLELGSGDDENENSSSGDEGPAAKKPKPTEHSDSEMLFET